MVKAGISVVMTVHDREPELLVSCLRSLYVSGMGEAEVIVVNDRSMMDYEWARVYLERFGSSKWIDLPPYEGFRLEPSGYGNPARAFNAGIAAVTQPWTLLMSSDVLATSGAVKLMQAASKQELPFTPRVVDLDTCMEYCGASRPFPMPWFLSAPTENIRNIKGWDENYLHGLCFEDNDFVCRLGLECGKILADWSVTVWHQTHFQPAYEHQDPAVKRANDRNRDYTKRKWKGIPFDKDQTPVDIRRRPHPSGFTAFEFVGVMPQEIPYVEGQVSV